MKKLYLSIILFISISPSSFSLNITWTGSTSNSWSDSSNFSPMLVPTQWDTVTIDTTANHPILSGNTRVYKLIMHGDTLDLNGYQMQTGNEGEFRGGVITGGSLKCSGTLAYFSGTVIDAEVIAACSGIQISGSTFHQKAYFENTGNVSSAGQGGNVFHDVVTIKNNSADEDFVMAGTYGDIFHDSLYVIINSAKNIQLAHTDTSIMKGCVRFQSSNYGSISIGKGGGVSIMEDNGHLAVESGDFYFGQLMLMNIQQTSTTGHRLVLTTSGMPDSHPLLILTDNYFKGETDFESPHILLKGNSFEANTILTKTGGNSDLSDGNNHFLANATITNTSTSGYFNLGGNKSDFYHGNVTFTSGSKPLIAGYKSYCYFYKNVEVNSTSVGISYAVWAGDTLQQMSGTHVQTYGRLVIDKPTDKVVAATPIDITSSVTFTSGHLETDSTNIITFLAGSGAMDASNNSFVSGPVKKVGNTAFEFPVGKGNDYSPLILDGTSNVSNAFQIEYFNVPQSHGTTRDTTIEYLNHCDYWRYKRLSGNDSTRVTISWDAGQCALYDSVTATVAVWDSLWKDFDVSVFNGDASTGSIRSSDSIGIDSTDIIIAFKTVPYTGTPQNLEITGSSPHRSIQDFFGLNGANTIQPGSGWEDPDFREAIAALKPSTIRFPGGELGNWWDWRRGWFVDADYPFQNCTGLPIDYEILDSKNNSLQIFAEALGVIGGKPLFMLNMLTSDLPYQIAMLHEAEILGMPVGRVELGNEYYRGQNQNCEYNEIFPSVTDYAVMADEWIDKIDDRFGAASIAVIGTDYSQDASPRQLGWNTGLNLSSFSNTPHAATIHPYYGSGLGLNAQCNVIDYNSSSINKDDIFTRLFKQLDGITDYEHDDFGINDFPVWMTEYNLFDRGSGIIHGSWAHAMKTAAFTMAMLEREWITGVNCHAMVGNAVFGAVYGDKEGFDYSGIQNGAPTNFCSPEDIPPSVTVDTKTNSLTSLGLALEELGDAMRFATQIESLTIGAKTGSSMPEINSNFSGSPYSRDAVFGWKFNDANNHSQLVIINMSDQVITIDVGTSFTAPVQMKVVTISSTTANDALNRFVTEVDRVNSKVNYIQLDAPGTILSGDVPLPEYKSFSPMQEIPGYSLVRYTNYNPSSTPEVYISASETSVCEGYHFYLYANASPGAISFNWYNGSNLIGNSITPFFRTTQTTISNYSVEADYTGFGWIPSTNSVSITPKDVPVLSITTSEADFCISDTDPIVLTATLNSTASAPNIQYCWIAADEAEIFSNEASQLMDEIEVKPLEESTYIVYATDGLCSVREEITIGVLGNIDFGSDPVSFCSGGSITLDPRVVADTYEWDDGTTTHWSATLNVNPGSFHVYTLTVTDGTCEVTAEVNVLPVSCCSTSAAIEFLFTQFNGMPVTSENLLDEFTTNFPTCVTGNEINCNETVYVEGELLIDQNMIIRNVTFLFSDRGKLTVDNGVILELHGCTLTACSGNMWQGVHVMERGRVSTFAGTIIEHAYHGIYAENKTRLRINNTRFENNFVGIKSLGAPAAAMVDFRKEINRGMFRSIGTLRDPYTNITPLPDNSSNRGYAGVVAENDLYSIKRNNGGNSEFDQLANGILATNSILNISDTWFDDMQPETEYGWQLFQGYGVQNSGIDRWASVRLSGFSGTPSYTFNNCRTGIGVSRSALTLISAVFTDVETGVSAGQYIGQTLFAKENTIEAKLRGIDMIEMDLAGRIFIDRNTIEINHPVSSNGVRAISLENYGFMGTPNRSVISCNSIILDNAEHGIFINSLNQNPPQGAYDFNLGVFDNMITVSDNTVVLDGISLNNSKNYGIIENSVIGDGTTINGNGYRIMMSPEGVIHNNYSTGTYRGFYFQNESQLPPVQFVNNIMEVNARGLELDPSAFIGIQSHAANNWTGYTLGANPYEVPSGGNPTGAFNLNQTNDGIIFNRFTIDDNHTIGSSRFPRFEPSASGWFLTLDGNESVPYYSICEEISREVNPVFSRLDSLIADDSITVSAYQAEFREIAKINLYEKIKVFESNNDVNEFFSEFMEELANTPAGNIIDIRDSIFNELKLSINDFLMCQLNDSTFQNIISELDRDIDENHSGVLDDTTFVELFLIKNPLDSLIAGYLNQIDTILSGGITSLNAVTVNTVIESNLKVAIAGVFSLLDNEFNRNDLIEILTPISVQCPEEGGPGVFISRSILNRLGNKEGYHDEMICYPPERIINNILPLQEKDLATIEIFPNPTNALFQISSRELDLNNNKFQILDLTGREVPFAFRILNKSIIEVELTNAVAGVYTVFVSDIASDNLTGYSKLILIEK